MAMRPAFCDQGCNENEDLGYMFESFVETADVAKQVKSSVDRSLIVYDVWGHEESKLHDALLIKLSFLFLNFLYRIESLLQLR